MIRFLVNRPIAVIMSFILVILLGIIASQKIPISLLPDSNIPRLEIVINNPGDSPEDFDLEIVQKIRNNVLQVNNVIDINSYSNTTKGKIELIFNYDTDLDLVFFEINEKIDEVLSILPYKIDRPKVIKSSLSDIPSLYLSVSLNKEFDGTFIELCSFVEEKLKTRLEQCDEISFVDVTGLAKNVIRVSINENYINSLGITLSDIKKSFEENDFSFGNIEIEQGHFVYDLSLENSINSVDDIKKITLSINGKIIPLSQIAKVYNEIKLEDEYYYNQNKAISLAVIKKPGYRERDFINKLDAIIKGTEKQYPYIKISKTKDQTIILKETLSSLSISLFLGVLLAIIITLLFLKSVKNVILIIVTVLASLVIDILLFYLLHISINLISVSGLILGVGLMIDNIIIVLDSIEQKVNNTKDVKEGSIHGVVEITTALISSALTTCSIFVPLIFLSGLAGVLFYDQAISVTIALISSFCVSIFLLPTIYLLLNKKNNQQAPNYKLFPIYERTSRKIFNNKLVTLLILVAIIAAGFVSFMAINKEQLPEMSSEELVFKIEWNQNLINKELIDKSINVIDFIKDDITSSEFYINQQNFLSKTPRAGIEDYETYYILKLKNIKKKDLIKKELFFYLKDKFNECNLKFLTEENALSMILINDEYNLKVISYDREVTSEIIQYELKKEYFDLVSAYVGKSQRIEFSIDENKIFMYDIDKNSIIEFIKLKLGEEKLLDINYGNNYIPVTFATKNESLTSLLNSKYITEKGNQYNLKDLILIEYKEYKKGVEADIGGISDILYIKTEKPERIVDSIKRIFSKSIISFEGSYKFIEKLKKEIFYIIVIILILLYLILAIQFESLKLPVIILLEIPIDIAASFIILYLTNQTLNVMSFIGIIIMCGIIINDSILKIDLIRKLNNSGIPIDTAIRTAGKRRLNAIVMTSLTTLLAITPVLFQNDVSTKLQAPLIISLIGGLLIGTFVSVFIIPILYKKLMQ